jgi:hypothetical protein
MVSRFPKKVDGVKIEYQHEGIGDIYKLHCEHTGNDFNGVPSLAWYHENGEQANRSINGKITFIIPTDKPSTPQDKSLELPKAEPETIRKTELAANIENYLYVTAYNIAARRNENLIGKDMFGQIVNATKNSLIELYKGL